MTNARSGFGVAVFEKKLYVFGGEDIFNQAVVDSVERYDPDSNSWELLNPMIHDVHGNAAAVVQRFIYVLGGSRFAGSGEGNNFVQRLDISNIPKQPKGLSASSLSSSSIRLKWQDLSNNEQGYIVQGKSGVNSFRTVLTLPANAKQCDVKQLNPATSYSFRVVAQNGCGSSVPSNIATAATKQ
jgi:hypothetical protein